MLHGDAIYSHSVDHSLLWHYRSQPLTIFVVNFAQYTLSCSRYGPNAWSSLFGAGMGLAWLQVKLVLIGPGGAHWKATAKFQLYQHIALI